MAPRLSIITVCLNDKAGLERTLDSVSRQGFRDRELVVIDGGSTDGSVGVLEGRAAEITRSVSEPDRGIYDAQNKGIGLARGEYCLFLNAGDYLASDDALERFFAAAPTEEILYGDVFYSRAGFNDLSRKPERITLAFLLESTLPHQATVIRRELLDRLGRYDTSLRIAADYDFFLNAIVGHRASTRHVAVPLSVQEIGGLSSRPESQARLDEERRLVQRRYLSELVLELHDEVVRLREAAPSRRLRALLRPVTRPLRWLSRKVRGRPT